MVWLNDADGDYYDYYYYYYYYILVDVDVVQWPFVGEAANKYYFMEPSVV